MCSLFNKLVVVHRFIFYLSIMVIVSMVTVVMNNFHSLRFQPRLLILDERLTSNILCHHETADDALPSAEDLQPPPDSIFFHETSCIGGLDSRKACAVESAARMHPERDVYVFFSSSIPEHVLRMSCLSTLSQFKNIKLARLHVDEYTKGTELRDLLIHMVNTSSVWPVQHTADMLRFVTMYKYGGIYLDTDLIVVKRLTDLGKNWAAREIDSLINTAAMAFSRDRVGHRLVTTILQDIKESYRPDLWDYNGSGALMRSLAKICHTSKISHMSAAQCSGFQIYEPVTFYPIHWLNNSFYFKEDLKLPENVISNEGQTYAHHLWNKLSIDQKVEKDSFFDKLAKIYCPTIWSTFADKFGT